MKTVGYFSLNKTVQRFIKEAVRAREYSQAHYSLFEVGAAVGTLNSDGKCRHIGSGCNVENSIFEVTHAEQAAIAQLAMKLRVTESMRIDIVALALLAEKDEQHAVPCGFCRQLIREFGHDGTLIYGVKLNAAGDVWQVEIYTLGELLPYSFGPNNLNG